MAATDVAQSELIRAKETAEALAKQGGYRWEKWLEGPDGVCTAMLERGGRQWALSFKWTPADELRVLTGRVHNMDWCMRRSLQALDSGGALQ